VVVNPAAPVKAVTNHALGEQKQRNHENNEQ
jgi:hypothetical protein